MNTFQGRAASRDQEEKRGRELRIGAAILAVILLGVTLGELAMSYISEHARAAVWEAEQ